MKIFKRTLALFLVFAMLFSSNGTFFAQEAGLSVVKKGGRELYLDLVPVSEMQGEVYDYKELANIDTYSEVYNHEWDKYSTNFYYNQLEDEWKECWDAFDALCISYLESTEDIAESGLGNIYLPEPVDEQEAWDFIFAFIYSNPQYYYLLNRIGGAVDSNDRVVYLCLKSYGAFLDGDDRQAATENFQLKVESLLTEVNKCTTEAEMVKKANDLICDITEYYDEAADGIVSEQDSYSQSAYSALCLGKTVCAGYADSMTILLNGAGVDTVSVISEDHQWNKVRISGIWYNIDSTWADQESGIYYDYFFRSDDFYEKDDASHIEKGFGNLLSPECDVDIVPDDPWEAPGECEVVSNNAALPTITVIEDSIGYKVTMSTQTANADIYYTLDGTIPGISSAKSNIYTGEFYLDEEPIIKAITVCNGYLDSAIATYPSSTEDESYGEVVKEGACGENVTWKLYDTGTLLISGTGAMEDYTNYGAPWNDNIIFKVIVQEGVTHIGDSAFDWQRELSEIELPESLISIGSETFDNCDALTSIKFPSELVFIGKDAFTSCDSLKQIYIPKKLCNEGIADSAFYSSYISEVEFEPGVTKIPEGLLYGTKITQIDIPDTVTCIEDRAFWDCYLLEEVNLPENLNSIGYSAFGYCTSLEKVDFPANLTTIDQRAFEYCEKLESIEFPEDLNSIGMCAFGYCTSLTKVDLPKNLTSIGYRAFEYCTSLTKVFIPKKLCDIGNVEIPFEFSGVSEVEFETGIKKIPNGLFSYCVNLKEIVVPDTVKTIGMDAFRGCRLLSEVDMPDNITTIGSYAFSYCDSLVEIDLPENLTSIDGYAFSYCDLLTTIELPDNLSSVGNGLFKECVSLKEVILPTNLTYITYDMFYNCDALTKIEFSENIFDIRSNAFRDCDSLREVILPRNLMAIEGMAFADCDSLSAVTIPNSVTNIWDDAFIYCDNLTIYCYKNSYAQEYAIANDIPYEEIDTPITNIKLDLSTATVKQNETLQLNAEITPLNHTGDILWTSSDETMATVSETGLVTVYDKLGDVTISAVSDNGISASCVLTIIEKNVSVEWISLDHSSVGLIPDETLQLTITILPNDATNKLITWSSSDDSVATVDENGLVTAIAPGTVTVTAKTTDGSNLSVSCEVTVSPVKVSFISLSHEYLSLNPGDEQTIVATVLPSNATNNMVIWSSSDDSIAKVDGNGKITAINSGTAYIIALAADGSGVRTSCRVVVKEVLNGWKSENGSWYYYKDGTKHTGWLKDGGVWYYMHSDGKMATGWLKDGGSWYYFNASGRMMTGWVKDGGAWYFFNASGQMMTGWVKDGGAWYFFNTSGRMMTGWVKDGGSWYYFNTSGRMMTGWVKDGGSWYYFNSSGRMMTGWVKDGGTWYYLNSSGSMVTGWLLINGTWYYFNNSGAWIG